MAPLDVVNAQSGVATDQQALISAQSTLNYQQQIIKQAIARNLNDAALSAAPVIPTDRVSLEPIPEETQPVEALVQEAFQRRPELEEAVLTLRNDEITLKGARNALLPTLDVYGFYGSSASAGREPELQLSTGCLRRGNTARRRLWIGARQSVQQHRPRQGRRIQRDHSHPQSRRAVRAGAVADGVPAGRIAAGAALYADSHAGGERHVRAHQRPRAGAGGQAARDYDQQSLDAEEKKLHLGASTTANVLQQQRNLAIAEDNLIAANAAYAKDRAGLYQTLPRPCSTTASICRSRGGNRDRSARDSRSCNRRSPARSPP